MSRTIRLGAVSYLNVRPLVYGLAERGSAPGHESAVTPERASAPGHDGTAERGPSESARGARSGSKAGTRSVFSLRFDVPSVCARLLAESDIDLGMVPSITYLDRPDDFVVPGVCIGSFGPVASVALFTRKPIREVRTIAHSLCPPIRDCADVCQSRA
jgi:predicted solute-binding protein